MIVKNKEVVRRINEGFGANDVDKILSCLADDIKWTIAGYSTAVGKEEFRKEIHNEDFEGIPVITIKNEIAEGDHVAVEGFVQSTIKGGEIFEAFFHNTYRLEDGKIKEMTSYVVPKK
ncbi:MAG: nuclear transport factor 2 family protein [Ferruginibacter sp.]|nr:nuclear transport factor 2 family protein [Chitinophagaceae bacterium]